MPPPTTSGSAMGIASGNDTSTATRKASQTSLPEGLLLAYYGDDFTGSTDVLEAFTAAGLPTVLFLQPPGPDDLQRFKNMRCVGIAGQSRGRDPAWMREHLPKAFRLLAALGAPVIQYKLCSTFDSSPQVGSIGQAIDLGVEACGGRWSPTVVGAPRLQRYQAFGNLFAAAQGDVFRIDRHPTMSRHPVTPMDEGDLRVHLARQTQRRIGLVDIAQITQGRGQAALDMLRGDDTPVVMIDVLDTVSQIEAGRLVWENRGEGVFSASSSGLEYALAAWWRDQGLLPQQSALPQGSAVSVIAAVSGSCSPMSAAQIRQAAEQGFHVRALDVAKCLSTSQVGVEIAGVVDEALGQIAKGVSPIIHSALGPDDPSVKAFDAVAARAGLSKSVASERIGQTLAEIMQRLLDGTSLRRIVVAGGDSSGAVASHLGIQALTVAAALAPGVPLCRAWSSDPKRDGLEIALKGGQLGGLDFYANARDGKSGP